MTDDNNDALPPPKVTDAPAAIWLVYGDIERDATHQECSRNGDVGWCEDKQFDSDVEYVRSDTIEAQAERIRVLREALEVARNGLAWYIDMHPDEADDSDAETMAQIDTALEATK